MPEYDEIKLIEHVIRHCQIVYDLGTTKEALEIAKKDGFLDKYDDLTSVGRDIAQMMVQDSELYQEQMSAEFDIDITPLPDFFPQHVNHQH